MDREEAIKFWKFRYENAKDHTDPHWEAQEHREHREYVEALDMAIEALSANETPTLSEKHQLSAETPTTDLISRADAIKAIWGDDINPSKDGMVFEAQSHIDRGIRLMPSADRSQAEWVYSERCSVIEPDTLEAARKRFKKRAIN